MPDSVSLRSHLLGALSDVVETAVLGATLGKCSIVSELASLFVDYEEEGNSLFLDVFLTDDINALLTTVPDSSCIPLGTAPCHETGIQAAVKKTAPLVRGCWKMYITSDGNDLKFGVFRDSGHPLNVSIGVALQSISAGGPKFIRIKKLARGMVRVINHIDVSIDLDFSNSRESKKEIDHLNAITKVICSKLDPVLAQSCETYVESLLCNAIRGSHGALIAVTNQSRPPAFLADCISLTPRIGISSAVQSLLKDPSSIGELLAIVDLVNGLVACDGILVVNTKAEILAYNAFIKLQPTKTVGGARRRAFDALCSKVGRGIAAAYIQSQDGFSDLRS